MGLSLLASLNLCSQPSSSRQKKANTSTSLLGDMYYEECVSAGKDEV